MSKRTRIVYKPSRKKGYLKSKYPLYSEKTNTYYYTYINKEDMTYHIARANDGKIIRSTEIDGKKPPKTFRIVQKQVKDSLKKIGVKFELELRDN